MKRSFLFTVFFVLFAIQLFAVEKSIFIIDKTSEKKDQIIDDVLQLQQSLIVDPFLKEELPETGFLLIKMQASYIQQLLEEKNGRIIASYNQNELMGYIILTEVSEFMELYQDPKIGSFECEVPLDSLETYFKNQAVGYIEQIAVKKEYAKKGIGNILVTICKNLAPDGLIADIFIDPIVNFASLAFFAKMGFYEIGTLSQKPKNNFFAHHTRVFCWLTE